MGHVPELLQERLMRQEIDILEMVVGLVLAMNFLLGLARMYAFQDAEAPAAGGTLARRSHTTHR